MFEAVLDRAIVLKRIIDSISALVQEVNFDCSPAGIALQALDNAHVALVSLILPGPSFQSYRCDRPMALGINLEALNKILRCAGNDEMLTLTAPSEAEIMTLGFCLKNKTSVFELQLLDINMEKLEIPDCEYSASIQMPSAEFQRMITSLQQLGDAITVTVADQKVQFQVAGPHKASISLAQDVSIEEASNSTLIRADSEVEVTFAMRYLHLFTRATHLSPTVVLRLSLNNPLVVEYQIEDISPSGKPREDATSKNRGHIKFYVAPKIDM